MVKELNTLKLVKGFNLSNEELKQLYAEMSSKIYGFTLNESNINFYFSNEIDAQHYLMMTILHRLKTPLKDYQKHFKFLNLSNPYNYHYNVWASLCLAERDSADFNIDYSLVLKKMFNVVVQSYMHSVEENQRESTINMSEYDFELDGSDWGNPSFGYWGDIESIDHANSCSWSDGYINYSLGEFFKYRFDHDKLPEDLHYVLIGEIDWKDCNSVTSVIKEIGIKLNAGNQIEISDNLMQRNNSDISSLMTAFLVLFETNDNSNLEKIVLALSNNISFSEGYPSLNNVFNNLKLIQEKRLHLDFLDIYKLMYHNSNNIKDLNDLFKAKELGKSLLSGLLSFDSKTNTSNFKLANGKSFDYLWTMNSYNENEFETNNDDLPF